MRVGCWHNEPWPRGLGEDRKTWQKGFDCRGGASPIQSLALLEFLVGEQDQKHSCFCCLRKLSSA